MESLIQIVFVQDGRIWKERILAARARRRAELLGEIPPFTNGPNW
jgi:hypothetical protein